MSEKFTPGPWHVAGNIDGYRCNLQVLTNDNSFVCRVNSSNHPNTANARLIAAAPELLEACNFALARALQTEDQDSELISKLNAAIAKAEGK